MKTDNSGHMDGQYDIILYIGMITEVCKVRCKHGILGFHDDLSLKSGLLVVQQHFGEHAVSIYGDVSMNL